jgi:hypothetical protein
MPLAKSNAISLVGLTGTVVEVEADFSSNLPEKVFNFSRIKNIRIEFDISKEIVTLGAAFSVA